MAKPFRYQLQILPGFQQHSGVGVAHRVEGKAFSKLLTVYIKVADAVGAHHFPIFPMNHKVVLWPFPRQLLHRLMAFLSFEYLQKLSAHGNHTETVGGFWNLLYHQSFIFNYDGLVYTPKLLP